MPLRPAAFHDSISRARLDELFRSERNQLFAGTTAGHCSKCGAQFSVFFPADNDPENLNYLTTIEQRISDDCNDGVHTPEILLNVVPRKARTLRSAGAFRVELRGEDSFLRKHAYRNVANARDTTVPAVEFPSHE